MIDGNIKTTICVFQTVPVAGMDRTACYPVQIDTATVHHAVIHSMGDVKHSVILDGRVWIVKVRTL